MLAGTCKVVSARNGDPVLRVSRGGQSVFLNSSYDPQEEASQWASSQSFGEKELLVLFGLGSGYHLEALLRKAGTGNVVFVVEPDDEILAEARALPVAQRALADPRVVLCRDWDSFKEQYVVHGSRWKNIRYLKLPVYTRLLAGEFQAFSTEISRELNSLLVDRATVLSAAWLWQTNLLRNLPRLAEAAPVGAIFGCFAGLPAIIVSAGPSLSRNVDLLHQAKGKAVIIATGTTSRLLAEKSIAPDFIVTLDGNEANYESHFRGLTVREPVLVFDPAVHYRVAEEYQGRKALMLINEGNLWLERFSSTAVGLVKIGPSVANVCLSLAYRFGCDPIILIGQDLAYTGGLSHARGTHGKDFRYKIPRRWTDGQASGESDPDEKDWRVWSGRHQAWVEGIDGNPVLTDRQLLSFLHWFESVIRAIGPERTVIDATEGGARIKGTLLLSLKEALSRHCVNDISARITEAEQTLFAGHHFNIEGLVNFLKDVERRLNRLAGQCTKAARLSSVLVEHVEHQKPCNVSSLLRQLSAVDRSLKRSKEYQQPLHYVLSTIYGILSNQETDGSDSETSRQSHQFYLEVSRNLRRFLPLLNQAIRALQGQQGGPRQAWI
ncbi:MAG: motility associated factor glycosyltransferase family protein [Acidobacteriota bacterium]